MNQLSKVSHELGFKLGDELTTDQMVSLLSKQLDNQSLLQIASVTKNFAPVAKQALESIAKTAEASGRVDEATIGALKQAIIELGRFNKDDDVEIRRATVSHIGVAVGSIINIQKQSSERSDRTVGVIAVVFAGTLGLARLLLTRRGS